MRTLSEQVSPILMSGWAILGHSAAAAFDRFVRGGIQSQSDLAAAESVAQAIILHPQVALLDPYQAPTFSLAPELAVPPRVPLKFSLDSREVPVELRPLLDMSGSMRTLLSLRTQSPGVYAIAMSEEGPRITDIDRGGIVDARDLGSALNRAAVEFDMATMLLQGSLAGASFIGLPPTMRSAFDTLTHHHLDALAAIPRVLPEVVRRADARTDIPNILHELRVESAPIAERVHREIRAMRHSTERRSRERAGRSLQGTLLRYRTVLASSQLGTTRLRGVLPIVAGAIAGAILHEHPDVATPVAAAAAALTQFAENHTVDSIAITIGESTDRRDALAELESAGLGRLLSSDELVRIRAQRGSAERDVP